MVLYSWLDHFILRILETEGYLIMMRKMVGSKGVVADFENADFEKETRRSHV
jgi:hypothetical protein